MKDQAVSESGHCSNGWGPEHNVNVNSVTDLEAVQRVCVCVCVCVCGKGGGWCGGGGRGVNRPLESQLSHFHNEL